MLFSAGTGQQALDNLGRDDRAANGVFTRVFLDEMQKPGVDVSQMAKNVRNQVASLAKRVGHLQVPALYDESLGEFMFRPGAAIAAVNPAPAAIDPQATERSFWDSIRDSRNPVELQAYLDQYPTGAFVALATARLKSLQAPAPPLSVQVATVAPNVAATVTAPAAGSLASMGAGRVFRDCAECPEMVVIPPGRFSMGSPTSESSRDDDEGPQRDVNIINAFALGKYEVTRGQFARFVQDAGYSTGSGCIVYDGKLWNNDATKDWRNPGFQQSDSDPVTCVNWNDARAYVEWLSRKTGQRYRLPTEAEWEYAARAGTTSAFSFRNSITPQQANYATQVSYAGSPTAVARGRTVPVGSYPDNSFGLHDVHGNVWEWTEDCWNTNYNGAPVNGLAWTTGDCGRRVLRGGSWSYNPQSMRSANRFFYTVTDTFNDVGLRVARTDF